MSENQLQPAKVNMHKPTSTKPQARKLGETYKIKMVAKPIYSMIIALCCKRKPHFLFGEPWKGIGKGMFSRVSSVMMVIHLAIF